MTGARPRRRRRGDQPPVAALLDRLIGALGAPGALAVVVLGAIGASYVVYALGAWLGAWA